MAYIVHRDLEQPSTGRRILEYRRAHDEYHDPERRVHAERRLRSDRRRKTIH